MKKKTIYTYLFISIGWILLTQSSCEAIVAEDPDNPIDSTSVDTVDTGKSGLFLSTVTASGVPFDLGNFNYSSAYGSAPDISVHGNSDNSYDIAWIDKSKGELKISRISSEDKLIKEIVTGIKTNRLIGFTKVTTDNSFVVGYATDNSFGDTDFELRISRIDENGQNMFSTRIFGNTSAADLWSKGTPASFSSGRLMYNPNTDKIAFYTGHTMRWDDNVRHQGGYIGFLDMQGNPILRSGSENIVGNTWFCSHNFDQRILVSGDYYYTLAHGDAYPRALVFAKWSDSPDQGSSLLSKEYFQIPGSTGDNTTNTETGGFVLLSDNNFGVVYATSEGRSFRDIRYVKLDESGNEISATWITTNTKGDAYVPQIVNWGTGVSILWEQADGSGKMNAQQAVLDLAGKIESTSVLDPNVRLQPLCDPVILPNKEVVWAIGKSSGSFDVYRLRK